MKRSSHCALENRVWCKGHFTLSWVTKSLTSPVLIQGWFAADDLRVAVHVILVQVLQVVGHLPRPRRRHVSE